MKDQWGFVLFCGVAAMLLNQTCGLEEKPECKDNKSFKVLEKCCNIPDDEMLTDEDKSVGLMCDNKVFGFLSPPSTDEERLAIYECMDECFYNATNFLTADMKLNETALLAEYEAKNHPLFENHPHWKEPFVKSVKICIEKNVTSEVKPDARCKSGSFQFSQCFGLHTYLHCPEEVWNPEGKDCEKAKEKLKNC